MGHRLTTAERNVASEARAVEAGHHARVQPGGWVKVTSDTHGDLGKYYRVEFVAHTDGLISFSCQPAGPKAYEDDHRFASTQERPGLTPCMHASLAARRLEREGLANLDEHGRWSVESTLLAWLRATLEARLPSNPLDGLPQ